MWQSHTDRNDQHFPFSLATIAVILLRDACERGTKHTMYGFRLMGNRKQGPT